LKATLNKKNLFQLGKQFEVAALRLYCHRYRQSRELFLTLAESQLKPEAARTPGSCECVIGRPVCRGKQ